MSIMIFALAPPGVRVVCAAAVGVAPKSLPRQQQRTQHAGGALSLRPARPSAPPAVGAPYVAVSATRPRGRAQYAVLLSFFALVYLSIFAFVSCAKTLLNELTALGSLGRSPKALRLCPFLCGKAAWVRTFLLLNIAQ